MSERISDEDLEELEHTRGSCFVGRESKFINYLRAERAEVVRLQDVIRQKGKELDWYGDEENHDYLVELECSRIDVDHGQRARAARELK